MSWLEPNGSGPTLGAEIFIANRISIGSDAGLIFYQFANRDNLYGKIRGQRIKPELRYYFYKKNRPKFVRLFVGLEGHFFKTTVVRYEPLASNNINGTSTYYNGGFDEIKKVVGAHAKVGITIPRFFTERMVFETFLGVGIKVKRYSYQNIPAGYNPPEPPIPYFFPELYVDGTYPSMVGGFKILYKIN